MGTGVWLRSVTAGGASRSWGVGDPGAPSSKIPPKILALPGCGRPAGTALAEFALGRVPGAATGSPSAGRRGRGRRAGNQLPGAARGPSPAPSPASCPLRPGGRATDRAGGAGERGAARARRAPFFLIKLWPREPPPIHFCANRAARTDPERGQAPPPPGLLQKRAVRDVRGSCCNGELSRRMCSCSGGAGHEEDRGGRSASEAELAGVRGQDGTGVRTQLPLPPPSRWPRVPAREREEPLLPRARAAAGARRAWSPLKGAGRGGGGGRAEQSAGAEPAGGLGSAMGAAGPRRPRRCPGRVSRR